MGQSRFPAYFTRFPACLQQAGGADAKKIERRRFFGKKLSKKLCRKKS